MDNTSTWLTTVTTGCTGTVVSTPPTNRIACAGDTATFTVIATGTGLTYQWYKGTSPLGGKTGTTLTLTNVTVADVGTYNVVISNICGNSVTNSATLALNANTVVTAAPANLTNCPGTTAFFSVSATGTALTYQW